MCMSCNRIWTALQIIWSLVYIIFGAIQLMAGIFFTISVPEIHMYSVLFAGSWNVVIGISIGMVACISVISRKRQEILLYMAVSILTINCVNIILVEYLFHMVDIQKILEKYTNHVLVDYACLATRIATGVLLAVSFVDSQLLFCSMQSVVRKHRGKKIRGSHEQVSDIEYIIPRPKGTKGPHHTVYDAYAQSWVFEGNNENNNAGSSNTHNPPYFEILQNGGTPKKTPTKDLNGKANVTIKENGHVIDNPVVHVEEASDDSTSNSDRKLCYMKSFSRSQSPMVLSASSSQLSLNLNQSPHHQPIYEYLEKLTEPTIYRSRLDTALSNESRSQYQTPQISRRSEVTSPKVEKVQYASLMKELQKAIVNKKEPPSSSSSKSPEQSTTHSGSENSKNSDADFSKELEAALQLIQDLESPNTIETPSETKSPLDAVGPGSNFAGGGGVDVVTSPVTELYTFKPSANGKASVIVHYPDSQSTSGYSSPSHGPTSTASSINGSNPDIKPSPPTSFSIHNNNSTTTVISLYSTPNQTKAKSITLVKITGNDEDESIKTAVTAAVKSNKQSERRSTSAAFDSLYKEKSSAGWKLNSLLRRKKHNSTLPKLAPELEGAIIKSESLAYLSDIELLARHQRNQELQREIEKKVFQQLGVPQMARTESNC